ncbi:hypothetical protein GOODEAATRI_032137, partial [Goodea atripinnis]
SLSSSSTINLPIGKNNVLKQKLLEVVGTDKWRINILHDHERPPRRPSVIVNEALELVGTTRLYHVINYNCEHFATELRYGNPKSQQVVDALDIGVGVTTAVSVSAMAILGAFLWKRSSLN